MDSKVKVTADKAGNVIVKSENNPEYGHIRVEQTRMVIDENGFARRKNISALIPGTIEDLHGFGWSSNDEVDGKVIIKEALKAFNEKDPERDFKVAGKSGVVCKAGEAPIYRKHFYTLDDKGVDALLDHDNVEEIKAAYATLEAENSGEPGKNKEFDL